MQGLLLEFITYKSDSVDSRFSISIMGPKNRKKKSDFSLKIIVDV